MQHLLEAIFLGFVQGLTEFLPVSSSAHLRIVGAFLPDAGDPGAAFTAITQIGTEAAVVVFFWRDIVRIVVQWFRALLGRIPRNDPDARIGWLIIIGTIPIGVLGFLFQSTIETTFRSLWIIAATLILFGVILGIADLIGSRRRELKDLTVGHGIVFGLAQSLALIPGVSRSGGTITAGLLLGYTREAAARYAFLLAIPAVFASGFFELYKTVKGPSHHEVFSMGETAVATVVAFVVGLAVIAFFMRWISRHSFLPFVVYRVALGAALLVLLSTGVIQP
ncbi:MAG: undecaprenyl-diphosphate phosphatase [Microbacterium sp.]|uniref:undecaprenyl-diphosphate phosphatase n=1 Tax=Microbacterium sp. TaxID=51671 RepID=UPI00092BB394|nr:undecaprenyl-diphosphate phosphatase [Microbacterium sp.]OJU68042.1 MAG: undecaprenyl-diphosphatase UppP [Microbacterium sp. 70-38]MBN9170672.1 undecaprenyl-diphosphate phosphatase [Microbacterium sp.]MBN9179322.1 undecaprenyl-diphosphate phosphatase [Microbacterium sp.]MBN9184975.1 undecaprenyl-diphosphate phosphatase [Microbacterium sp.]MBN9191193.1 undecaprenyl-diphosphate phosphatase [Microbacterium sp.]